jgi:hypothetical protein
MVYFTPVQFIQFIDRFIETLWRGGAVQGETHRAAFGSSTPGMINAVYDDAVSRF